MDLNFDIGIPTRRLPIYLLLDTSNTMAGAPIQAITQGVRLLYDELMADPMAIETVHISIIVFADQARIVTPLTELVQFNPPQLQAGGARVMGAALRLLREALDHDIIPDSPSHKGDYKAMVLLMTDGLPSDFDVWQHEVNVLKNRTWDICTIVAMGCGGGVDQDMLKQLTDAVLMMETLSPDQINHYFKWVSQSVKPTGSTSSSNIQIIL